METIQPENNQPTDTANQEPAVIAAMSPQPAPNHRIGSWYFFWWFCAWSFLFWLLEVTYAYFFVVPGNIQEALIVGSAFAGGTLVGAALFSSAIFKWRPKYARYWRLRRNLGVAGVVCITIHAASVLIFLYNWDIFATYYTLNPIQNPIVFGSIAYVILLMMAFTSTDWAVRKLGGKRWKNLHRCIYVGYPAAILHFLFISPLYLLNGAGGLLLLMTALTVFGQVYWFFRISSRNKFKPPASVIGFSIMFVFLILLYISYQHYVTLHTFTDTL